MRRIFLDSNILIAGAYSRRGASRAILLLGEAGLFRIVVSRQVIDEAERNLREKLPAGLPKFAEILALLEMEIVPDPGMAIVAPYLSLIEDKDAPILAAAREAGVERLISLNTSDFTPAIGEKVGIAIQTPAEFINEIRAFISTGFGESPP